MCVFVCVCVREREKEREREREREREVTEPKFSPRMVKVSPPAADVESGTIRCT